MAPAVLEAGLEPLSAPTGATNFAGIPATGWIPPDCTMAADPANPRVIWFYSEYTGAIDTWATWVGSSFF